MSINDITNIQHCFVKEEFLNGKLVGYTLTAKDGYTMRIKPEAVEEQDEELLEEEMWFTTISIPVSFDLSQLEVREILD